MKNIENRLSKLEEQIKPNKAINDGRELTPDEVYDCVQHFLKLQKDCPELSKQERYKQALIYSYKLRDIPEEEHEGLLKAVDWSKWEN